MPARCRCLVQHDDAEAAIMHAALTPTRAITPSHQHPHHHMDTISSRDDTHFEANCNIDSAASMGPEQAENNHKNTLLPSSMMCFQVDVAAPGAASVKVVRSQGCRHRGQLAPQSLPRQPLPADAAAAATVARSCRAGSSSTAASASTQLRCWCGGR